MFIFAKLPEDLIEKIIFYATCLIANNQRIVNKRVNSVVNRSIYYIWWDYRYIPHTMQYAAERIQFKKLWESVPPSLYKCLYIMDDVFLEMVTRYMMKYKCVRIIPSFNRSEYRNWNHMVIYDKSAFLKLVEDIKELYSHVEYYSVPTEDILTIGKQKFCHYRRDLE